MLIKRSFPYSTPDKTDIRPYLEKFDKGTCPLCKQRQTGGKTIPGSDIEICDVCYTKSNRERNSSPRTFSLYLEDLCEVSSYITDTDKIQPGEEILGTVIYEQDEDVDPVEKICDMSQTGIYVAPFELRFVYTRLRKGHLVTEANTNISFVIPRENISFSQLTSEQLQKNPEYVELYPPKEFAHEITSEVLAANTI